ncbi:hypothetical protein J2T05_000039 [Cupriavidus necator]|nr:hypothetical protein [Cupriavidus necator]
MIDVPHHSANVGPIEYPFGIERKEFRHLFVQSLGRGMADAQPRGCLPLWPNAATTTAIDDELLYASARLSLPAPLRLLHARLPKELFRPSARMQLEFKDCHDQDLRASRARVSKAIGQALPEIPRYHWQIASDGFVDGEDIEHHLLWIFHLLPPDARLCDLLAGEDFDYWISTF